MGLDASIYGQIQQPKVESQMNALTQIAQLQGAQNQNKLTDLKFAEADRALKSDTALRDVTRNSIDPATGKFDAAKMRTGLAGLGDYKQLNQFETDQATQSKAVREAEKAKIEGMLSRFEITGRVMSAVKDQASYEVAVGTLSQEFPDMAGKLPPTYDPATIARNQQQALSVEKQLEQKWKAISDNRDERKFAYQQTNDADTRKVTIRGQDVSASTARRGQDISASTALRGQNLTDARSREANANGKVPSGYRANADGSLSAIPGGPAENGKAPTEFQGKAAGYGARAEQADKIIASLGGKYSPAAINAKVSVQGTPLIGGMLGAATNTLALNANDQRAEQAQRDFINAVLRQESGAAIASSEFDNAAKQYFPQPGDAKEVIAQKAQNRKLAIQGFKNSAGKAAFSSNAPVDGGVIDFGSLK